MFSRFSFLILAAALAASPARAAENDGAGAAPIATMERADKNAEPEAPADESRMQVPDLPHPTGEKPPAKSDDPKAEQREHHEHAAANDDYGAPTLRVQLTPSPDIEKGKEARFMLALSDKHDKALGDDALEERHTKKIHLLLVDEGFSDYQHLHPKATKYGWDFSFTPATARNYRLWIDVKPRDANAQMIPILLKGKEPCKDPCVDSAISLASSFDGNKAVLSFDGPVTAGAPVMAKLALTGADGKPFDKLEPVMGAYAHVAAFSADGGSVVHVHPTGPQPGKPEDRGVSPLSFMLHPEKPGILKVFVQIGMDNKDVFLPFTVKVEESAKK